MAAANEGSSIGTDSSEHKSLKILILGQAGIGKTSLLKTYMGIARESAEELGVFKVYRGRLKNTEKNIKEVLFIDLNPGSNCPHRRASYPKDVNAILLCFSIEKYETLKSVYNAWIIEVRTHFGKNIPILLAGLKSDVRIVIAPPSGNDRIVRKSEAEAIHTRYRFHGKYMECSMNNENSVKYVLNQVVLAAIGE